MKKLFMLVLFAAVATVAAAADWDGAHGPFTVLSFYFESGAGAPPGIVSAGPAVPHTTMYIKSSDPSVSGVRVSIEYRDKDGLHKADSVSGFTRDFAAVTFPVRLDSIVGTPVFTAMRDSASY